MNLIAQFSIRSRLFFSLAMVMLSSVLILVGVYFSFNLMGSQFKTLVGNDFPLLSEIGDLQMNLLNLRRYEKDYLLNAGHQAEMESYGRKFNEMYGVVIGSLDKIQIQVQPTNDKELVAQIKSKTMAYQTKFSPVIERVKMGEMQGYEANKAIESAKKDIYEAEKQLFELKRSIESQVRGSEVTLSSFLSRALFVLVVVILGSMIIITPVMWFSIRSIVVPLDQAKNLAAQIASGDLTSKMVVRGQDETGRLLDSLMLMQEGLQRMVGEVKKASNNITLSSAEIASANFDLSGRTEQAASSLEETAASLEEVTETVNQTAMSAREASRLAAQAASQAVDGGDAVKRMVNTMHDINGSSKKIADITSVIDGIAFQTNILALNAAVEAARAGESGRGFAVVASEVRALASRSADAAKEIKSLIATSVEKVEYGTDIVETAGVTIEGVVQSVQQVSQLMQEIAGAASEEAGSIAQINSAVSSLDQLTQQNSALVEEGTAAAASLKDQAQSMMNLVSTFKLNA